MEFLLDVVEADIARAKADLVAHLERRIAGDTSEDWALVEELRALIELRDTLTVEAETSSQ